MQTPTTGVRMVCATRAICEPLRRRVWMLRCCSGAASALLACCLRCGFGAAWVLLAYCFGRGSVAASVLLECCFGAAWELL
eukprot:11167011-Lingulodinium_polyedra.AAC.1